MSRIIAPAGEVSVAPAYVNRVSNWRAKVHWWPMDRWALGLALCAVPISIALTEIFLFAALAAWFVRFRLGQVKIQLPRIFNLWLVWVGLAVLSWSLSPEPKSGWSEIRHLVLIATCIIVMPALGTPGDRQMTWCGIFLTSTLCSLFLLGDFVSRYISYRTQLGTGDEISLLLRSGGLLNHWSIYGTVEILAAAGFLGFWSAFPNERRRWWPVAAINGLAIL